MAPVALRVPSDEHRILINPVVRGKGQTMFEGLDRPLQPKLASSHVFDNGNVLLCYDAVR